jgi:hypothetical protein
MSAQSRIALARGASRAQLKARVAIDGPSGAGKTWTALEWAFTLADPGQVPIMIDTEHGSGEWYSDQFPRYQVVTWTPPYNPAELAATIKDAAGLHPVVVIDSLSHFWEGEGGTRDIADAAAERSHGNTFAGWKVGTPALRHLIDTILSADAHVIATMRSKMEYVLEQDDRGRQVPKKVGMAPVMRQGVEYEFTAIADMDLEHRFVVTKSRCSAIADLVAQPHRAGEVAKTFRAWLDEGDKPIGEGDAQRIAAAINAAGQEARAGWLQRFACKPTALPEGRLAEANQFVAELGAGPGPEDDGPPDGAAEARPGGADDREAPEGAGDTAATPPSPPIAEQEPQPVAAGAGDAGGGGAVAPAAGEPATGVFGWRDVAIKAGKVFKAIGDDAYAAAEKGKKSAARTATVDRLRHALTYACTDGATASSKGCTAEQLHKVRNTLDAIERGEVTYVADLADDRGVTWRSPSGKEVTVLWADLESDEVAAA